MWAQAGEGQIRFHRGGTQLLRDFPCYLTEALIGCFWVCLEASDPPFFIFTIAEVVTSFPSSGSLSALKSKIPGRLSWNSSSKVFPFIWMEPMLKPVGNSPRSPSTSLSPPHLHGGLHVQQVYSSRTKINPLTLQSKTAYVRHHHFFTTLVQRWNISLDYLAFFFNIKILYASVILRPYGNQLIATTLQLVDDMVYSHAEPQWIMIVTVVAGSQFFFLLFLYVLWTICVCECAFLLLWGSSLLRAAHVPFCAVTHRQMSVEVPTS